MVLPKGGTTPPPRQDPRRGLIPAPRPVPGKRRVSANRTRISASLRLSITPSGTASRSVIRVTPLAVAPPEGFGMVEHDEVDALPPELGPGRCQRLLPWQGLEGEPHEDPAGRHSTQMGQDVRVFCEAEDRSPASFFSFPRDPRRRPPVGDGRGHDDGVASLRQRRRRPRASRGAVVTRTVSTPRGSGSAVGPETSVTSCPRFRAASRDRVPEPAAASGSRGSGRRPTARGWGPR